MAKMSLGQFMKDSKKEGKMSDILNLKETGKLIVFLHPETGIESRKVAYLPVSKEIEVQKKKGKGKTKEMAVVGQMIVLGEDYNKCPIRQLTKALRDDDNLASDDVVFEVGEGKNKVEILKGDILGEEGYDWKRRVKTTIEYLFGAVDKDNVSGGVQILIAPKSLGKAVTKVIENQMEQAQEEDGDAELGDPFKNPYAFKLVFDEDEQPSLMYQADYFKAKLTKDIKELLEGDGVDIEPLTKPTSINAICDILEEILVADVEGFDLDDFRSDSDDEEEEEKPKKKGKKSDSKKSKKKDEDEEDEEDAEDSDDEEDEEEEVKKPKKGKKKEEPKKAGKKSSKKVEDEEDEEDEDEEEEDEKPKKGKGKVKKEEKKPAKSSGKGKKKVEEEDEEDSDDEDEEEDEEPKKPSKSKEKSKSGTTSKETKKGKSGTGKKTSNKVECPACGEMVDEDAESCPECGAEFDDESVVICPECGHENPEDASKCKKCKTELIPF